MLKDAFELTITHLGGLGDGIGEYEGRAVYVPFTCPGDVVWVEMADSGRARLLEVVQPSAKRQPVPCAYFGQCGGCSLQHLSPPTYDDFKRNILVQSVRRLGAEESLVEPLVAIRAGARRRVEFKVAVAKGEVQLGFYAAKSHQMVAVEQCLVLTPTMDALIEPLRQCIAKLKKPGVVKALHLTEVEGGFDVCLSVTARLHAADIPLLRAFASQHSILRVAQECGDTTPEILFTQKEVQVSFAGVAVELPVASFLQATLAGQRALTRFVLQHTQKEGMSGRVVTEAVARSAERPEKERGANANKYVADIFCGCGTYGFPLAVQGVRVAAYEGNAEMVAALHNAARRAGMEERMHAEVRDLVAHPLSAGELKAFDAVVINPPRSGAKAQIEQVARSGVDTVVMVSCNPATFERDAALLLAAGYRLVAAVPIDQFYWSSHLEVAAAFSR